MAFEKSVRTGFGIPANYHVVTSFMADYDAQKYFVNVKQYYDRQACEEGAPPLEIATVELGFDELEQDAEALREVLEQLVESKLE